MKDNIDGGATLWARKTIDSEIFFDKPDKWFKIWFFIVNEVSHQDNGRYKRGERYFRYEWIMERTKATKAQVHHCLRFLRKNSMIATHKKTHGLFIEVLNYNTYQSLDTYKRHTERQTEDKQKTNRRHNINKNGNNVKNVNKNIYSQLFTHWINQDIYKHRKNIYQSEIKTALNKYNFDEIKNAITNYAIILKDEKYYFNYRWTLGDFLKRGIDRFIDLDIAKGNFLKNQKGGSNGNHKQLQQQPKTESEYDHLCKVYRNDT